MYFMLLIMFKSWFKPKKSVSLNIQLKIPIKDINPQQLNIFLLIEIGKKYKLKELFLCFFR